MPSVWRMMETVTTVVAVPVSPGSGRMGLDDEVWRGHVSAPAVRHVQSEAIGDVEEY
jgi:hypothetical protein